MRRLATMTIAAACGLGATRADQLELAGGGVLSGEIRSISPDGLVTADLEVAGGPVSILAEKVRNVRFAASRRELGHDTMLILTNGDRLPCDILRISGPSLVVDTAYAGNLTIPRSVIDTAQLGIRPRKTVFTGPDGLKHWEVGDNWHFEDGALVSDGRGTISRGFPDLPESFSLSFHLAWASNPMFRLHFSSDDADINDAANDRYHMMFGPSGIEIRRQTSKQGDTHTLISANRTRDSFRNREATFEIRFDRQQKKLQLYIDGQLEGEAIDPLPDIPTGKTIILQSEALDAAAHHVSKISLGEWDSAGERHRSEDRGDFGEDSLINNKGERFGGRLLASEGSGRKMVLLFKSPLSPEPLRIPTPEISTLFLRNSGDDEPAEAPPLALVLAESGSLGASSCTFGPEEVTLEHALLGSLKLDRDVVRILKRREQSEEPAATEPEE